MKPIEPGCLALVIEAKNREHIGMTVRVVDKVPQGHVYWAGDYLTASNIEHWAIDTGSCSPHGGGWIAQERSLLRIDGHEPATSKEEEEMTA